MKVVYIAGPYRAATAWQIEQNIRRAEAVALNVARLGAMPLCPHALTRHYHGELTDRFWLDGTAELLRRCDAVMFVDGWEDSEGSRAELDIAIQMKIPTFYECNIGYGHLKNWLAACNPAPMN